MGFEGVTGGLDTDCVGVFSAVVSVACVFVLGRHVHIGWMELCSSVSEIGSLALAQP